MSGYFQTIAALKFAIKQTREHIHELKNVEIFHQERIRRYREIITGLENSENLSDLDILSNYCLFEEGETEKQSAYWNLGEERYRLHQTRLELKFTKARKRFYKSQIKKLIC